MTTGERVKSIRKSLNLTLETFSEGLGVTRAAVSNIERGQRSLTDQMATAICRAYNVNYDYLVYGDGEMFTNLPQTVLDELCAAHNLDAMDRLLFEKYIELNESDRAAVKRYIRSLIDASTDN